MDLRKMSSDQKAIVVALAVIGAVVMNLAGRIEGPVALDFIKWLVMTLVAALAWENGKVKAAEKTAAAALIAAPAVEDNEAALAQLKKAG